MNVKIVARALLKDRSSENGLSGQVYKKENGQKGLRFISFISVPITDYVSDADVPYNEELTQAKEGRYILQLMLPDGDIINKDFELKQGEQNKVEVILPYEGPHEWTSLHTMKGYFKQQRPKKAKTSRAFFGGADRYSDHNKDPRQGYSLTLLEISKDRYPDNILNGLHTIQELAELIRQDASVPTALEEFRGGSLIENPTIEDNDYSVFRFYHSGVMDNIDQEPDEHHFSYRDRLDRRYLIQQSASGAVLTCLPVPWTIHHRQVEIELLVDKDTISRTPQVSMAIGDPTMNSILGYINAGAIQQATEMIGLSQAMNMLFEKITYPFAATVGGYLLVMGIDRKKYRSHSDRWKDWLHNLSKWFEWLPDGAILYAALHFVLGEPIHDKAYEALMKAYERGLPYFTFGLKLMMDGMRYFAREDDVKARECLSYLETIADQTDPSQPFLSITFANHWNKSNIPSTQPQNG